MTTDSLSELGERIRQLARVPTLLVACDYDGTVAPFADDPMAATPHRETVAALRSLAEQASTHVAIISGRSLRDLAALSRLGEEIRLIGSHGSEFDLGFSSQLGADLIERRSQITAEVHAIAARHGARTEEKPTGIALHFRGLDTSVADALRAEVVRGPAGWPGIWSRNGRDVLEMSVVQTNKGRALNTVRSQVGAAAVIFIGDDVTDEDAFRTLAGPDVGVKVGEGQTAAAFRVRDISTVAQVLALLAELRSEWLRGSALDPLQEHSVLSDLRTAAVISPAARIAWLCVPRIDSAAVFAELVGGPSGGYFAVTDGDGAPPSSYRYRPHSMLYESRFSGFTLTDYLDVSEERAGTVAGRTDLIRVLDGHGTARIEFAPRLDFGRFPTQLAITDEGVTVVGAADLMVLRAPSVHWTIIPDGQHHTAVGTVDLHGEPVVLEFRAGSGSLEASRRPEADRRDHTDRFWRQWQQSLRYPAMATAEVQRAALMLKSLCHGPTGAIVSAVTTSLPEHLGGVRNWDYRYCWLRDGALVATTLLRLGSRDEAEAFIGWMQNLLSTRNDPERLAPLYNVAGRHLPPEADLAQLSGYAGSRPVRVGNAADRQIQLDAFGPLVELVYLLQQDGVVLSADHWRFVESMVTAVSHRWATPDHGMWSVRRPPRHYLYSKIMCWQAIDRAVSIAQDFLDREPTAWVNRRDRIAELILERGWNPQRGAFTAAYDSDDLDASVLAIVRSGFLPPDDERVRSTVHTIDRVLRQGPTVLRYLEDDGLPGRDGGVHLMTAWLIDALALIGEQDRAHDLFDELVHAMGSTGMLTAQIDPTTQRALGNFPQAYSYVGFINSAINLSERHTPQVR